MFRAKRLTNKTKQRALVQGWYDRAMVRHVAIRQRSQESAYQVVGLLSPAAVMYLIIGALFKLARRGFVLMGSVEKEGQDVADATSFVSDMATMTAAVFTAALDDGLFDKPFVYAEEGRDQVWVIAVHGRTLLLLPLTSMLEPVPEQERAEFVRKVLRAPAEAWAHHQMSGPLSDWTVPGSLSDPRTFELMVAVRDFIQRWKRETSVAAQSDAMQRDFLAWRERLTPEYVTMMCVSFSACLVRIAFDAAPMGSKVLPVMRLRHGTTNIYELAVRPLHGSAMYHGVLTVDTVFFLRELSDLVGAQAQRMRPAYERDKSAEDLFIQAICESLASGQVTVPDLTCQVRETIEVRITALS